MTSIAGVGILVAVAKIDEAAAGAGVVHGIDVMVVDGIVAIMVDTGGVDISGGLLVTLPRT